ncbi:MAG TPA: PRC-barrel domain-containing protein [Caulobacteraceae bacterium]|nr:PRC-barrel domain-containing protein [Caulobacteraceae bacterium]
MSETNLRKSGDIIGRPVCDAEGARLGTIRELVLDAQRGEARFVIVEAGGLFGGGGKFHPLPWRLLRFDPGQEGFSMDVTKERLKHSPAYDREQLASGSYAWGEQAERYFAEPDTAAPTSLA